MKVTNVFRKSQRTYEQKAEEQEVRDMFRDWKPGPEELLASGKWKGPVIVEGQQQFWQAIRQVRAFREAQGLTLKDVSQRCGIDVATLSKLENGKQANPTLFTMLLYVGAVGKRLHFAVRDRPQPAVKVTELREAGAASNEVPRAKRGKATAERARRGRRPDCFDPSSSSGADT
jgi:transcriptional regulator with XRE-family HTH domain